MQATIKAVSPKPRVWDGPKGTLHFINVVFEDGSAGDYGAKPETSQQHTEALQSLIGNPGDYELEPKGEYQGTPQFKIKSYPGQTIGKGGGGKQYVPSWHQTEDGERYTQERMDRRTALMQAVAVVVACTHAPSDMIHYPDTLHQADAFYEWLRAVDQKPVQTSVTQRETAQVQGGPLYLKEIWEGPGQCERCNAPAGRRHGKVCLES